LAKRRTTSYSLGLDGEEVVAQRLIAAGWQVIDRRWRGARGELDLVARKDGFLRFVEVKLRDSKDPVGLEAIDDRKVRALRSAGEAWLQANNSDFQEVCFAVAWVTPLESGFKVQFMDDPF
jgi:putative endonuclease